MRRYSVLLVPDADDGGYAVLVPALPGCITEGDSADEALANARAGIALHIESLVSDGEPVPLEARLRELASVEV